MTARICKLLLAPEIQEDILMQEAIPDFMITGQTKLRRVTKIADWVADWEQQEIAVKCLGMRLA